MLTAMQLTCTWRKAYAQLKLQEVLGDTERLVGGTGPDVQLMHTHLHKGSLMTALDQVCLAPTNLSTVVTCTVSLLVLPAPLLQQVLTSSLGQDPGISFCINLMISVLAPIANSPILYYISGKGVGVKTGKKEERT